MASITKRGTTYRIAVSCGRDINGKQIMETTTFTPDTAKTEKQNQKALNDFAYEFEARVKSGKYLDGEKLTFMDFSKRWIQEHATQHLEAKTLELYEMLLSRHILPEIGNIKLSKVQPTHLNSLYNMLLKERKDGRSGGYAPKTIKHIHNLISAIYTTAIQWNAVMDNPCSRVAPPKQIRQRNDIKFFTLEQAETFIGLLDTNYTITYKAHDRVNDTGKPYHVGEYTESRSIPKQFKIFFLMALFCGMRRGELIALEWDDLDFQRNSVNVTKSTSIANGKPLTKAPKTASSIRLISVPPSIIQLAKEYHREQLQYRLTLGEKWEGNNYIFIQWNGKQMHPDTPYNTFKKIIKRHNESTSDESKKLPNIPLHGLRHTSATLLISQNVDVRTVSGRLGHSQTSTTMDIYAHSLKKMDEKASDILEDLFNKKVINK